MNKNKQIFELYIDYLVTQGNHIFMSLLATVKLECLSLKKGLTTFGLKMKLYMKAQKAAIEALHLVQASTA